jgi:ribulose-phosphate 3-epimerase
MVADPYSVGSVFAHAGAHTLIAHVEALGDSERAKQVCGEWRGSGVKQIGLAILFQTPLEDVEQYLPYFDFVLLMTIPRIGVQGIPYEKSAPARVADFHTRYPEISIAVDGGVSEGNIADLTHAGARHFGVGSAIAKAADPAAAYTKLLSLAEAAIV